MLQRAIKQIGDWLAPTAPSIDNWAPNRAPDASIKDARNQLLELARQQAKSGEYAACLDALLTIIAIDGVGRMHLPGLGSEDNIWFWEPSTRMQAHGVLKMAAKSVNCLAISDADLEARYFSQAQRFLDSIHNLIPPVSAAHIWATAWPDLEWHISTGTKWRPRAKTAQPK